MTKLFLNGSSGKMGESIKKILEGNLDLKVLEEDLSAEHDCIIDFSRPESTIKLLESCKNKKLNLPMVIGTTGFTIDQIDVIKEHSKKFPILLSFNLSDGIYNLKEGIRNILHDLQTPVNCIIEDMHHINKVDAPSGTAIDIKKYIEGLNNDFVSAINITSKREGAFFGIHHVRFEGDQVNLSISHKALSRNIFAQGAINAALSLIDKEPGFYSLESIKN